MESIVSTFHIDWKIIIAQLINFSIVFVVLYLFALKPLSKLMKERSERISKGISDAKVNAEILNKTQKEYDEILVKAKNEAHIIFQEGKKEAEIKKTAMLDKAKEEVAIIIDSGKKILEAEKIKMVDEAKNEIVSIASLMVEKIISKNVDGNFDNKTLKDLDNL